MYSKKNKAIITGFLIAFFLPVFGMEMESEEDQKEFVKFNEDIKKYVNAQQTNYTAYQIETIKNLRLKLSKLSKDEKDRIFNRTHKPFDEKNIELLDVTGEELDQEGYLTLNSLAKILHTKLPFLQTYKMIEEKHFVRFFNQKSQKNLALINHNSAGYFTKKMFMLGHLIIEQNELFINDEIFYIKLVDCTKENISGISELSENYKLNHDKKLVLPIIYNKYPTLKLLEYGFKYNSKSHKTQKEVLVSHASQGSILFDFIINFNDEINTYKKEIFMEFGHTLRNLHNRRIIHGDLSMANFALSKKKTYYKFDLIDLSDLKHIDDSQFSTLDLMFSDLFIRTFIYEIIKRLGTKNNKSIQFVEMISEFIEHTIDGYIGFDPSLKHKLNKYLMDFYNMIIAIRKKQSLKNLACNQAKFWDVSPIINVIKNEFINELINDLSDQNFYILQKIITKILPISMHEQLQK